MLRARIERLLNDRVARTSRLGWMSAIASSLTLVAVVVASGQLPPLVVFAEHEVSAATSAGREFLEASQRLPLAVSMAAGSPASTAATPRGAGPTASHTPRAASAGAASRVRRAELGFEAVPAYIGPDLATVVDIGPPVLPSAPTASGLIAQTPPAPSALTRVSSAGTAGVGDRFAAIGSAARQSGLAINARAQRVGQHFVDAARLVAQKTHPLTPLTSRARHMQRTAVVYRAVLR